MDKISRWVVLTMGILLLLLGFGNIWDDSRVWVYDLTAICAGIGLIAVTGMK